MNVDDLFLKRTRMGIRQVDLAKALGLAHWTIIDMERNRLHLPDDCEIICRASKALDEIHDQKQQKVGINISIEGN